MIARAVIGHWQALYRTSERALQNCQSGLVLLFQKHMPINQLKRVHKDLRKRIDLWILLLDPQDRRSRFTPSIFAG